MPPGAPSKLTIEKARNGDVAAIHRLGSVVSSSLLPHGIEAMTRCFLHHVENDLQAIRRGSFDSDAISPPTLASLRGMHQVLRTFASLPNHWERTDLILAYHAVLRHPQEHWDTLLQWCCITIDWLTTDSVRQEESIGVMDRVFGLLFMDIQEESFLITRLKETPAVIVSFTRLWVACTDGQRRITSLPHLIISNIFSVDQLLAAFGGSKRDFAKLCLQTVSFLQNVRDNEDRAHELNLTLGFVNSLMDNADMHAYLVLEGLIPVSMECILEPLRVSAKRIRDSPRVPDKASVASVVSVASEVMIVLSRALALGPPQVIEAIDLGFLLAARDTTVYWDELSVQRFTELDNLGAAIADSLARIIEHVYHPRVFRHIWKGRDTFLEKGSPVRVAKEVPFAERWSILMQRIMQLTDVRKSAKLMETTGPCENPNCPKKGTQKKIRLRACSQCLYQKVCSEACHRFLWPIHKSNCSVIATRVNNSILRPATILSNDELRYYQRIAGRLAEDMEDIYSSLVRNNKSKLMPSPPSGRPTHVLFLDVYANPMGLRLLPILDFLRDGKMAQVKQVLSILQSQSHGSMVAVCAEFKVGTERLTVFGIAAADLKLSPKHLRAMS